MDGHPTARPPPEGVRALDDHEAVEFLDRTPLALLAFIARDDPASAKLMARLVLLEAKTGVPTASVDVDAHRLVANALGVQSAPMLLVFVDGEAVDRLMGVPPDDVLEDVVRTRRRRSDT